MFAIQSNYIKLNKEQLNILKEMCLINRGLYNLALYNLKQYYKTEKKFLNYETNYHNCKENDYYKLLQAGISQQTLKVVDRNFKSFFNLAKKIRNDEYRFYNIKMPNYLDKGELFPLILSTNAINIKDGFIFVPFSREMRKIYPNIEIKIPFPKILEDKKIKEVRIIPVFKGVEFKIHFVYEYDINCIELNKNTYLGIDLGIENLATCVDNNGNSFIIDGKKLKSINYYYNKLKKEKEWILNKQGYENSKSLYKLNKKRNNKVNDYLKKSARIIVDYCIENKIENLVIGYNPSFKNKIYNNKCFSQITFESLRENLKNLCKKYNINYIEQEEYYTSKASFLDNDKVPNFNPYDVTSYKFSGIRIKRGLYKSANEDIINSDLNAACNILRKSNFEILDKEKLIKQAPKRIYIN